MSNAIIAEANLWFQAHHYTSTSITDAMMHSPGVFFVHVANFRYELAAQTLIEARDPVFLAMLEANTASDANADSRDFNNIMEKIDGDFFLRMRR